MNADPYWSRKAGRQARRRPLTRSAKRRLTLAVLVLAALVSIALPILAFAQVDDPVPTPTHVRVDNRPSATPNPLHSIITLDPLPSVVTLPVRVPITCRRLVPWTERVNRCRIWFKTPLQDPAPKTKAYCSQMVRFRQKKVRNKDGTTSVLTKDFDTATCNLNEKATPGLWRACPFIPDEPGSAYAGLMENCQTVEVRAP